MLTIETIANDHYLPEKRARRRATTVEGYESSINLHVLPSFGDLEIADVTREAVQEWVDSMPSAGSAEKAYKCLRQIIRWAIRKWSLQVIDPTVGIELPRKAKYRPAVLDAHDLSERLRGFWGHAHEATVVLSSALGLRPGECYALEWRDVDMRSGAVRVSKTLQECKEGVVVYPTKTVQSDRTVYLPKWARERLRDLWRASGKLKGRIIGDAKPSTVRRRIARHAELAGLPQVTMENTRHTWATIAVSAGVAIETVAMILGHTSIETAYQHYIRPCKAIIVDAQNKVEAHMLAAA